jgi:hypothetical protein
VTARIEVSEGQPLARGRRAGAFLDVVQHLLGRLEARHAHIVHQRVDDGPRHNMPVSVDEPRQNRLALKVRHGRVSAGGLSHGRFRPDGRKAFAAECDGLGLGEIGVHGQDLATDEHGRRLGLCPGLPGRQGQQPRREQATLREIAAPEA